MITTKTTRRATFETNSSSSHTLTLGSGVIKTLKVAGGKVFIPKAKYETFSTPEELAFYIFKFAECNQDEELIAAIHEVITSHTGATVVEFEGDKDGEFWWIDFDGTEEILWGGDWKKHFTRDQLYDYLKSFIFGETKVVVEDRDLKYERENGYDDYRY